MMSDFLILTKPPGEITNPYLDSHRATIWEEGKNAVLKQTKPVNITDFVLDWMKLYHNFHNVISPSQMLEDLLKPTQIASK